MFASLGWLAKLTPKNEKFFKDWSKDVMVSINQGNEEWELIRDVPPEDL